MNNQTPYDSLGLIPYHQNAGCVINMGAMFMLIFIAFGGHWPIAGFFVGAIPTLIVLSAYHTYERDEFNASFGREKKGE